MIFLDEYLQCTAGICEMISQLPRSDEAVIVLLTQLVASKAHVFAGTMFSTFTALIHRLRGFASPESGFLYCYNDFLSPLVRFERCEFLPMSEGHYSWNRVRYPVSPGAYSWLREWPEAFDVSGPSSGEKPSGSVDLLADGASLHGNKLRYTVDKCGHSVISDWTDRAAFVSWQFTVPAPGNYSVEICYSCPEELSGSRYCIGLEGSDGLDACVWSTGGWTSLSPWMPLGRLSFPAGRSTLSVRITKQASDAVMNLSGVRLIPADV